MKVMFVVHGEPVGKARPRLTRYCTAYTPKKTKDYEAHVREEYIQQTSGKSFGDGSYLHATIEAYFAIPKSASKLKREQMEKGLIRPAKTPDIDNVVKSVLDALNGVAYKDDVQIIHVDASKWYSDDPRVEVTIND